MLDEYKNLSNNSVLGEGYGLHRLRKNSFQRGFARVFVSGHDFSRAVSATESMWALAPEG
jgi:hypothetical protein